MKSYRAVLAVPGAPLASAAAFIARLPISMAGLSIVLLISAREGNYAAAGGVTAAYIVAAASGAPAQGRLSDTWGQRNVLLVASALFVSGMLGFVWLVEIGAPRWMTLLAVVFAGLGAPQAGSFIRARWTALLRDRPRDLQTAFAFEAVVDEVVFVSGPIAATAIATTFDPSLALYITAALGFTGSMAMVLLDVRQTAKSATALDGPRRPLGALFVAPIVVVSLGLGMLFGSTEIIVVAFSTEHGARQAAGLVLGAWSAGSLIAGLLIGALAPPPNQLRRLQYALTGLSLTFVPFIWIHSVPVLAAAMFVGGFLIAPALISAISLIQSHVPAERLTEAIAWSTTGMAVGVAPGAALVGHLVDTFGPSPSFLMPMAAGGLAAIAAWFVVPPALRTVLAANNNRRA